MKSIEGPPRIDTSKYRLNEQTADQKQLTSEKARVMDRRKQAMLDVWEGKKQDELIRGEGIQSIKKRMATFDQTPRREVTPTRQSDTRQPSTNQINRMQELQRMSKPPFGERVKDFFRNVFG